MVFLSSQVAKTYWISTAQEDYFPEEIKIIKEVRLYAIQVVYTPSPHFPLFVILRVSGRDCNTRVSYSSQHPAILLGKHPVTSVIIRFEHICLLHAGPTLLACSLHRRFYILMGRKAIKASRSDVGSTAY